MKLAQAIQTAGILADSHGDYAAAKLLDVALKREANPVFQKALQQSVDYEAAAGRCPKLS